MSDPTGGRDARLELKAVLSSELSARPEVGGEGGFVPELRRGE